MNPQEEKTLVLTSKPVEPNTIRFYGNAEEMIKLSEGKFYFKGEEVEDKYQVYERFNEWLKAVEEATNKNVIDETTK
jgi:hypothetical protein